MSSSDPLHLYPRMETCTVLHPISHLDPLLLLSHRRRHQSPRCSHPERRVDPIILDLSLLLTNGLRSHYTDSAVRPSSLHQPRVSASRLVPYPSSASCWATRRQTPAVPHASPRRKITFAAIMALAWIGRSSSHLPRLDSAASSWPGWVLNPRPSAQPRARSHLFSSRKKCR